MNLGVDGFRFHAVKYLLEAEHLRDNPVKGSSNATRLEVSTMYRDFISMG